MHKETITALTEQVQILKQEVQSRQQFIDKILTVKQLESITSDSPKRYLSTEEKIEKLKEDLKIAYKLLAEREVEIGKLRQNKKVASYNKVKAEYNKLLDLGKMYA